MGNVLTTPLDAFRPFYMACVDANGTALGAWTDSTGAIIPVWNRRMKGNGTVDALKQSNDILCPQVVLTPFSEIRADAGDRWTKYAIQVAYYDFDYTLACTRATLITAVFDTWKGHAGAKPFTLTGWTAQLWNVENKQVTGQLNEADPRLWRAIVNLYFRNFDPA